jgi:hypothetical protein
MKQDGSGSYGADQSVGQVGLLRAWIASIVRAGLARSRKQPSEPPTAVPAEHEIARSLFAGGTDRPVRSRPADCPFPLKQDVAPDFRDWRILP